MVFRALSIKNKREIVDVLVSIEDHSEGSARTAVPAKMHFWNAAAAVAAAATAAAATVAAAAAADSVQHL